MTTVLICGGPRLDRRKATQWLVANFECVLLTSGVLSSPLKIICGTGRGGDAAGAAFAAIRHCELELFRADRQLHGHAALHVRNWRIVYEGKPDLVIAFPDPRRDAVAAVARKAGVPVFEVEL